MTLYLKQGAHDTLNDGACAMPTDVELERFRAKLRVEGSGCITWTGPISPRGYGYFSFRRTPVRAHRFSYALSSGPIPNGLVLDHLCGNRDCVNPLHLEPVTPRENVLRSARTPAAINAAKTHCPKGHPYDAANTKIRSNGHRDCATCALEESRRYKAKNRDLINQRRRARRAAGKAN